MASTNDQSDDQRATDRAAATARGAADDRAAATDRGAADDQRATVTENRDRARFELLHRGEVVSFATYRERDGVVVVPHVETVRHHRGNGFAAELMEGLLATVRRDGRTVMPLCPFAADHIRDNPQHHDLVASR